MFSCTDIRSGIYKIYTPLKDKLYIGRAENFRHRFYRHRWELRKGIHDNTPLQNAWNKYKEETFIFEIVECVKRDDKLLEEREKHYFYNYPREKLYNLQEPGLSNLGRKLSEETKKKMSLAKIGKLMAEETKKLLSEINKTRTDLNRKEVYKLSSSNGEVLNVYASIREAARRTGILKGNIVAACKGDTKSAGGWIWCFKNDLHKIEEKIGVLKEDNSKSQVCQINIETGEVVAYFDSVVEAVRITGVPRAGIFDVCNGRQRTAGGWVWKYISKRSNRIKL